ncbi:hypothetical protein FJT64_009243 [Amphibalanus amphitrite]|uniref:Transposable element P transposase n=1 Tax=Amphibalanus amphitrite TaxID=1232801 RepID=A0A6A4VQA7_AMPAM|nr:hypothetical protein FJT64_009243 [Amphibalanus amphitrite]
MTSQIDALLESKRPCPWDEQTIHRALVFRTRLSRSQYNFLRDGGMPLPSLTTLKTRLRKVTITQEDSGFARTILKAYLEEKPDRERPCVLMFDEMKLLRNHLLDNGLQLPGGGLVDKQLFADVLAIDRGKEFRILPKLGMESHVQT